MTTERTPTGKFKKGTVPNPKGRPKKKPEPTVDQAVLAEIIAKADGDPLMIMELFLKNADKLALSVNEILRISREIAPYKRPKLSSIEQTTKEDRQITVQFTGIEAPMITPLLDVTNNDKI